MNSNSLVFRVARALKTPCTLPKSASDGYRRAVRWCYLRTRPRSTRSTPVFVTGSARSGTSMTMEVFDRSMDSVVYHQGNPVAFEPNSLVLHSHAIVEKLVLESRAAVTVFKPLHENQHIGTYLDRFPDLRVIWLVRNYPDAVNSAVRKWSDMHRHIADIAANPTTAGWWGDGLSEESASIVRAHYDPQMSLETANALFWYLRHRFFFEQQLQHEPRVRLTRYEEFVTRPRREVAAVMEFCGCPFHPRMLRDIHAHSIGRSEPPKIDGRVAALCDEISVRFGEIFEHRDHASGVVFEGRLRDL